MTQTAVVSPGRDVDDEVLEALSSASRVLVAVAARSLAAEDSDITLAQHRALVVSGSRAPQRISDLAERLAVNSSTTTGTGTGWNAAVWSAGTGPPRIVAWW